MGKRYDPQAIPEIVDADDLYVLVRDDRSRLMIGEIKDLHDEISRPAS